MEAIVEHKYIARQPDELTLTKGDIIREIKAMPGGWWEGTLRDKRGMFPDNFVKVLKVPSSGSTGSKVANNTEFTEALLRNGGSRKRFCKVLYDYEPCNEDELTLVVEDTIEFLGEVEEGWWRGRLKGRVGVFPSNFVTPLYEDSDNFRDENKAELCKVLFPYESATDHELKLTEGDVITVHAKCTDKDWWYGELNGQLGLFPSKCVEVITVGSNHQDEQRNDFIKSTAKHSQQLQKNEKVHIKKSSDIQNVHAAKPLKNTISRRNSSGESSEDTKTIGGHSVTSSQNSLVGEVGTDSGNENTDIALGEELDGVEREEAPLSHLTASRAKAPRRRPPSSQRSQLRAVEAITTKPKNKSTQKKNRITVEELIEIEREALAARTRRTVDEMKELQDRLSERIRFEVHQDPELARVKAVLTVIEAIDELQAEKKDRIPKYSNQKSDTSPHLEQTSPPSRSTSPTFLTLPAYDKLLHKVNALERREEMLERIVRVMAEQCLRLLWASEASLTNK